MQPNFFKHSKLDLKSRQRGFTLVEVLVAIAILGILIAIAIPSFTSTIQRWRVDAIYKDLNTTIQYAKSEAIRRSIGIPPAVVTIARLNNANCAAIVNIANNDVWSCGWQVFLDVNGNGILDAPADTPLQTTTVPAGYAVTDLRNPPASSIPVSRWGQLVTSDAAQTAIPAFFAVTPLTGAGAPDFTAAAAGTMCHAVGSSVNKYQKYSTTVTCP